MFRRLIATARGSVRVFPRFSAHRCPHAVLLHRSFSSLTPPPSDGAPSGILNAPGVESKGEKFVMLYTCTVCDTRAAKTISKQAYYHGVVLVRCPKCENLHLIADRLGWFEDDSYDVEQILKAKGGQAKIVTGDNILELTEKDILGESASALDDKEK
ncbi:hypothetical protein THRCLA_22059 [Thraustotheca clavata]|uniref:DNL-type domain-containing protein n=1 Tax=Thraustotheca clavata TaxID=74557 RepID=A0A1V9ZD03_9STRA|nr:hypothetical protein THRCLA_22059 [Thraustotheca clavata]